MSNQELEIEDERYSYDEEYEIEDFYQNSSDQQEIDMNLPISKLAFNNSSQIKKQFQGIIIQDVKHQVFLISKELNISQGRAFFLLRAHNYKDKKCETIPDQILDDIYISEDEITKSLKSSNYCLRCTQPFGHEQSYSFECDHKYCMECFKNSLEISLKESKILDLTCQTKGCKERINIQDTEDFLSGQSRIYFRYILYSDLITKNEQLVKCPNTYCDLFFDLSNQQNNDKLSLNLQCSCSSNIFCSNCKSPAHQPIDCEMAKKFVPILNGYQIKKFSNYQNNNEELNRSDSLIEMYTQYEQTISQLCLEKDKSVQKLSLKLPYYGEQVQLYQQSFDLLIEGTLYLQNILIKMFFQKKVFEQIYECIYYELELQLKKFNEFLLNQINDLVEDLSNSVVIEIDIFFEKYKIELQSQYNFLKNYLTKLSQEQ